MRHLLDIAFTGLESVFLHPLRSAVAFSALVVMLLPYLVGLGLAEGLRAEAILATQFGADLYVTGSQFGRPAPIPLAAAAAIRQFDGVTAVEPRIVGEVVLGKERVHAVLVGLSSEFLPNWSDRIDGEMPHIGRLHELVIGTGLARRLNLKIGDPLLPFYENRRGDRIARVVGVFKPDGPPWQANLILTTFDSAAYVFDQERTATDLLVWCRPSDQARVRRTIERGLPLREMPGQEIVRPRVTSREDLLSLLPHGLLHREGVFNLHFVLIFVVGILVLLVGSGLGLPERRREIGILKATGWQTDEILLRGVVESVALSLAATCTSLLLAWLWLRVGNGYGIADLFLGGTGAASNIVVPFRLSPVPALLAFVLSLIIVLSGTLYSSWRAAVAPPREAMR
ncbi:MAG TPA: FtsX-like permease family protein [Gemmataceae bacterium]|jgi:ABC-type lipoprotein release transport system permease subunit